jgi:SAM-dependent methyltransferase
LSTAENQNIYEISGACPADALKTHERYEPWTGIIPLPPETLIFTTGSTSLESFLVVGEAWSQIISRYLSTDCSLLDIGCGCGKIARFFACHPMVRRYDGFDIISECIEWGNLQIGSCSAGKFKFHHFDLFSPGYNSNGKLKTEDLTFPVRQQSVDISFGASLFTHLRETEAYHYLEETARVLNRKGILIASIHTSPCEGERYTFGKSDGSSNRADVEPEYFIELARRAGLHFHENLGEIAGQLVLVFGKSRKLSVRSLLRAVKRRIMTLLVFA